MTEHIHEGLGMVYELYTPELPRGFFNLGKVKSIKDTSVEYDVVFQGENVDADLFLAVGMARKKSLEGIDMIFIFNEDEDVVWPEGMQPL